jgi:hypothetical protein
MKTGQLGGGLGFSAGLIFDLLMVVIDSFAYVMGGFD